jgi:hypothetical protein
MVAAEIMQRYKKLQFERGKWPGKPASCDSCIRRWITLGASWGDMDTSF